MERCKMEIFDHPDDDGFFFTKGEIAGVSTNGDGKIDVTVEETLMGEDIRIRADLVVLATGMVPATKDEPVVNLAYRQGPAFREIGLFGGYADSNFICFPYETTLTQVKSDKRLRESEINWDILLRKWTYYMMLQYTIQDTMQQPIFTRKQEI